MPKFFESDDFKKLNAEWQEKLAISGFVDAEVPVKPQDTIFRGDGSYRLKVSTGDVFRKDNIVELQEKAAYFDLLVSYVQNEEFPNKADKLIMTKRSEGMKIKEISEELKKRGFKSHRQTIRYVIRRYETKWLIKKWQPNQMKSK